MHTDHEESNHLGKDSAKPFTAAATGFICTFPVSQGGITYHIVVGFHDADQCRPADIRFTSFVGAGRRAFTVRADEDQLRDAVFDSPEALCRLAIGQVMRDQLYDRACQGDCVLDWAVLPWGGALTPVGLRNTAPISRRSRVGSVADRSI